MVRTIKAGMAAYEILEHTADMGFRVRAAPEAELFARAADAVAAGEGSIEERLVHYLNEVLWLMDGRGVAPARCTPEAVWGEPRDPARHAPRLVVKAVTFHQLRVWRDEAGWGAEVFLDV
jgi:SHS2 domain-containing protein